MNKKEQKTWDLYTYIGPKNFVTLGRACVSATRPGKQKFFAPLFSKKRLLPCFQLNLSRSQAKQGRKARLEKSGHPSSRGAYNPLTKIHRSDVCPFRLASSLVRRVKRISLELEQFFQSWLINGDGATLEFFNFLFVYINTNNFVTGFSETGTAYEANISSTYYCNFH